MVVLAGSAADHEVKHRDQCPDLEVVYNVEDTLAPLDTQWLQSFDNWVERARAEGRKVAFRCSCGCHRTGRLAAYYQMKYRGLSPKEAWDLALARGKIMEAVDFFSGLQQPDHRAARAHRGRDLQPGRVLRGGAGPGAGTL